MEVAVFGAGKIGREAVRNQIEKGNRVIAVLDNNEILWGKQMDGIEIRSPQAFIQDSIDVHVVIGAAYKYRVEIEKQLDELGVRDYESFDTDLSYARERIISYCSKEEMEDVILYHVLRDEDEIFYIDVGSNDPVSNSVTKWLYDRKNACGINIEPQRKLWELCERERSRDINLCIGVGEKDGIETLYLQEGGSTICREHVILEKPKQEEITIKTLASICEEYVSEKKISFLKVDVEGYERQVLLGADFERFRPSIVVMESTIPRTMQPSYELWENILLEAGYHYIYGKGVNRYYVADECTAKYDSEFVGIEDAIGKYLISRVKLEAVF